MFAVLAAARQGSGYSSPIRALHWLTAVLLAGPYGAVWALEHPSEVGANTVAMLHRSFGISVLVVTLGRLGARLASRIPPLPADLSSDRRRARQ